MESYFIDTALNSYTNGFSEDYLGYFSYPFGNVVLNIVDMRIIIYAILSIIFVPFAARAFRNHEVF